MELPRSPDSPAQARQVVREVLGDGIAEHAELLVSELVTNALVHTGSDPIRMDVDVDAHRVRVEVTDTGDGAPELLHPGPEDEHGRGLSLVDTLSSRWGVESRPDGGHGKVVWFELACERPSV